MQKNGLDQLNIPRLILTDEYSHELRSIKMKEMLDADEHQS